MAHAFRIKTGKNQQDSPDHVPKPQPPSLPGVLPDRVKEHIKYNFNPVLEGQETPMRKTGGGSLSNVPEHVSGTYRFKDSDDKKSLLDSIESKVTADAEWYMVESHECDHDQPDGERTGCGGWKVERQRSPPKEISKKYEASVPVSRCSVSTPEPNIKVT